MERQKLPHRGDDAELIAKGILRGGLGTAADRMVKQDQLSLRIARAHECVESTDAALPRDSSPHQSAFHSPLRRQPRGMENCFLRHRRGIQCFGRESQTLREAKADAGEAPEIGGFSRAGSHPPSLEDRHDYQSGERTDDNPQHYLDIGIFFTKVGADKTHEEGKEQNRIESQSNNAGFLDNSQLRIAFLPAVSDRPRPTLEIRLADGYAVAGAKPAALLGVLIG